jgi:hypothetical protein
MASEDPHPLPQLPFDLQLQIVERSDAVTVVRCAATHKRLRGAILGSAFRRRLGVDPALLLGFSFWDCKGHRAIDTPPLVRPEDDRITEFSPGGQPLVRLDDRITEFHPVDSRDGLVVVLRSRPTSPYTVSHDLRVCNAFTGDVTASLPPTSTPGRHGHIFYMVYRNTRHFKTSALLTSVRGGLCMFVLERNGISAWIPEAAETPTELEARSALPTRVHPASSSRLRG